MDASAISIELRDQATAIRRGQLRGHNAVLIPALFGGTVLGTVLVAALWRRVPHPSIALWALALPFALIIRASVGFSYRRVAGQVSEADRPAWLWRIRATYFLHGSAWGLASWLVFPADDVPRQIILAFAITTQGLESDSQNDLGRRRRTRLGSRHFKERKRPVTQRIRRALAAAIGAILLATVATSRADEGDEFKAQRALFNYDATLPPGVKMKEIEKRPGATVRDLTFDALTGKDVAAYVVTPDGKGPFAGVLWVHWLGEPATTNRTQFLNEAVALASQGVASVLVDAMWSTAVNPDWFGKRVPDEDYGNSIRQVIALRRAMDLLLSQPGVDKSRVGLVGHDYGGMYSMMMAGVDPRLKAQVYVAVAPSLNDWAFLGPQPKSKAEYLRQNAMLELTDYLRQVRGVPALLQFGTKDVYVSRVDSGIIASALGTKNRKFYETDHAMTLPEIAADRDAFLLKELVPAAAPPAKD